MIKVVIYNMEAVFENPNWSTKDERLQQALDVLWDADEVSVPDYYLKLGEIEGVDVVAWKAIEVLNPKLVQSIPDGMVLEIKGAVI